MNSSNILIWLFFLSFIFLSCSNSYIDNIERKKSFNYQDAHPKLRLATNGYTSKNFSEIQISGEIVHGSLTYRSFNGMYRSDFTVEINVFDTTNKSVVRESFSDSTTSDTDEIIHSQELYTFERNVQVEPGSYEVLVSVTDNISNKTLTLNDKISLKNPNQTAFEIANVSLLVKQKENSDQGFSNHTTYEIPGKIDSLKFQFQIINNIPDQKFDIRMNLLKFESDQSSARSLYSPDYNSSSIESKGIDYRNFEKIQSSLRTISQQGIVLIEYNFSELAVGNYRLEVSSNPDNKENYKAIDFGIRSENYPTIKNAYEMAEPLIYLMNQKDHERLMSIESERELKMAIDSFWLSNIGNSILARNVIAQFYQRVEEANKQFSSFKAGWKTDPGMIYILFGPPWYINSTLNEMIWSYSYNSNDPEKNFFFEMPRTSSKYYPFEHYILNRDRGLYNIQYQQVQAWLSGLILNMNL